MWFFEKKFELKNFFFLVFTYSRGRALVIHSPFGDISSRRRFKKIFKPIKPLNYYDWGRRNRIFHHIPLVHDSSLWAVNSQFPLTSRGQSVLWLVCYKNLRTLIGCLIPYWNNGRNILLHAFLLPASCNEATIKVSVRILVHPSARWSVRLRSVCPSVRPLVLPSVLPLVQLGVLTWCFCFSAF